MRSPESTENPEFVKATLEAKNLKQRPSNVDMLNLYALYKQSIFGDCNIEKPPLTDIQGRAKWEAWNRLKGTSRSEGQKQYINLVQNLRVK